MLALLADFKLSSEAAAGLIGVVLGFLLTAGFDALKVWRAKRERLSALYEEIASNLEVVHTWQAMLEECLANLPEFGVVRLTSVGFLRSFYEAHSGFIPTDIGRQRYVHVHIIYSNLKTIEGLAGYDATAFHLAEDNIAKFRLMEEQRFALRHAANLLKTVEREINAYLALPKYSTKVGARIVTPVASIDSPRSA